MTSTWRKSSYSSSQGGECVECAPLGGAAWTKSSYSSGQGGECVECAEISHGIAVRDSKNPDGPRLHFTASAWQAFLARPSVWGR
ncbi:DUF397 domain-containing protein [Streptomyces sp. ME19-01-6]|uniref:DUF397 domain-containing protein n=1 Tax=Streptomyces sp. ME19-01-6 TaxID=3028686 RepID=UPI0029AB07ED|nr:DUF397 domain-containing protein [Streptomyces sp. ME19-01-6]MDX3227420.1 DUF397 domain-containing protein [Streptomyces sp. ME19-01-6]